MKVRWLVCQWYLLITTVATTVVADDDYTLAMALLKSINTSHEKTLYNYDTMDQKLFIPQYDALLNDYDFVKLNPPSPILTDKVLPLLHRAASDDHVAALETLADLYLFGNYSCPTNYTMALDYYHRIVELEPNGHAYFMLGFIYGTGLFGEVEKDLAKSNLYYQFGMENGDLNSIFTLAYKNYQHKNDPTNCDLSLFYYNRLAHMGLDFIRKQNDSMENDDLTYNIRICDFNGGLYGDKVSETNTSIIAQSKIYSSYKDNFNEYNMDIDEHEYVHYYYQALKYYQGDYFLPKNYTKAFEYFQDCVILGSNMYGPTYLSINRLDRLFLSQCQAMLGRMYLKGQGTSKDYDKARSLLVGSIKLDKDHPSALNDLGKMYESGLINDNKPGMTEALNYYTEAVRYDSNEGRINLAKLLMKTSPNQNPIRSDHAKDIFYYMRDAAYNGDSEAIYHYGNFLQSGLGQLLEPDSSFKCSSTVYLYKVFNERMERLFMPHLRYAFDQLNGGNFKNALIGYLIAAEQGLEAAQVSAAYLLYQVEPFSKKKKTFTKERVLAAIDYLEKASLQKNVDATIFLGDLYAKGVDSCGIEPDYSKSFQFYKRACKSRSSHAAYNLGQMYEYGLGPANNSVDYHMAKRFYDMSLEYNAEHGRTNNKLAISLALLRLRVKYIFSKKKSQSTYGENTGWLNSFRKIRSNHIEQKQDEAHETANDRATAHLEGTHWEDEYQEYDTADYLVIFVTFSFFLIFFIQNVIYQIRRMRNNNRNNDAAEGVEIPEDEQPHGPQEEQPEGVDEQRGWRFNANGFEFRGGNFQFQFFAL